MSYLQTGLDLKRDALFLAGEPSGENGDAVSDYDDRVYEWLTVVQRSLVSGGSFGPSLLQPVDWYWARAWPRGAIQLVQPFNQAQLIQAAFSTSSQTVAVNVTSNHPNLVGYRIRRMDTAQRPLVISQVNGTGAFGFILTLQSPWAGETMTDADWVAYPDTYDLPADFVRGSSPLFVYDFPSNTPAQGYIDIIDPGDLERLYPQSMRYGVTGTVGVGNMPVMAARVSPTKLRFSHYLDNPQAPRPIQLEFEYIRRPPVITEGSIPSIPVEHRRVLSYGVAALILDDKDDTGAQSLYAKFQTQWQAMLQEHVREGRRMSSRWGVVQPSRATSWGPVAMTESGLPVYLW